VDIVSPSEVSVKPGLAQAGPFSVGLPHCSDL